MIEDKDYCMSSFLMFRTIADDFRTFRKDLIPSKFTPKKNRYKISNIEDIDKAIKEILLANVDDKTGIMLSGGIDSGILASYMPKGAKSYTLKCNAASAIDETSRAKRISKICELDNQVVDINWEDYLNYSERLMAHKGLPIHSIEVQIYKACLQAKKDGLDKLVFGESADTIFGGLDGLLSQDWKLEEFTKRFSYVEPNEILLNSVKITEPFEKYSVNGIMETYNFINDIFYRESVASYKNACELAGIEFIGPYVDMELSIALDLDKIRNGQSKYLIRELFSNIFPYEEITEKIPMPRPMGEWLKDWDGPRRLEFNKNLEMENYKGDQKWLIYILEWFLEMLDSNFKQTR